MNLRKFFMLAICLGLGSHAVIHAQGQNNASWEAARQAATAAQDEANPDNSAGLSNPEGMADRMIFFETSDAWSTGQTRNVIVTEGQKPRLELTGTGDRYFGRRGTWTSPEVTTDFPFTEIIPSWNVETPEGTGVYFHIRAHDLETSTWSPWLYIGQWGKTVMNPAQEIRFDGGEVRIDVLKLKAPADAFQLRATLQSFRLDDAEKPSIRRIAAVYSGVIADPEVRAQFAATPKVPENWARSIPVPFFAQGDNPGGTGGSTCSPTSLSMVAAYWGAQPPVIENCMAIFDPYYAMFGNWARATQRAGELGLDAWVTRIRSWDQVKEYIGNGQPIIASIRFNEGEFPSNVLKRTNGHLIVVRGLTPDGDPIVNDPASKERGEAVVYKAEELQRAWFGHGGVAYIVKGTDDRAGQ